MGLTKSIKQIKGVLGHYNLSEWWLSEFTDVEREYIIKSLTNHGFNKEYLFEDDIKYSRNSASNTLATMASLFNSEKERTIAYRCIEKAEALIDNYTTATDRHFIYSEKAQIYYKWRSVDNFAFSEAIEACYQQIDLSDEFIKEQQNAFEGIMPLPSHIGYQQLAISHEKRENYNFAIEISSLAMKQGWAGDWPNKIQRCNQKLAA